MNNDTKLLKIIEMCNFFLYIFSTNLIPPTGSYFLILYISNFLFRFLLQSRLSRLVE